MISISKLIAEITSLKQGKKSDDYLLFNIFSDKNKVGFVEGYFESGKIEISSIELVSCTS